MNFKQASKQRNKYLTNETSYQESDKQVNWMTLNSNKRLPVHITATNNSNLPNITDV